MLEYRKGDYFKRESDRIKAAGKNNSWYRILSKIVDDDAPQVWSVSDLDPTKDAPTLAEAS